MFSSVGFSMMPLSPAAMVLGSVATRTWTGGLSGFASTWLIHCAGLPMSTLALWPVRFSNSSA